MFLGFFLRNIFFQMRGEENRVHNPKIKLYRFVAIRAKTVFKEFKEKIEDGVFIMAHWDGTPETEELIKNETKATIRCIPLAGDKTPGKCMVTGKPSACRVLFARAY